MSLNTAWFSHGQKSEANSLWLGLEILKHLEEQGQLVKEDALASDKVSIALMHHGSETFFAEEDKQSNNHEREPALRFLWNRCHISLHGHTHEMNTKPSRMENHCYRIGVGGTSQNEKFLNNVNIIKLKETHFELRQLVLEFQSNNCEWVTKEFNDYDFELTEYSPRTVLSDVKIYQLLTEAKSQAGRRYSPKLSVKTDAYEILNNFADDKLTLNNFAKYLKELGKYIGDWSNKFNEYDNSAELGLLKELRKQLGSLFVQIKKEESIVNKKVRSLDDLIDELLERTAVSEGIFKDELERVHGKGADSPGFRQFQAEYMVAFPAGKLDRCRELIKTLKDLKHWINTDLIYSSSKFMLLYGSAGIGKTHAIVDISMNMFNTGQKSFVFFGEDFGSDDPWITMAKKIGFQQDISQDRFWDIIRKFADENKSPVVIFIDALNETDTRSNWKKWLPVLIDKINRVPNLKLCITCRDTYLDDVVYDGLDIPRHEHNGFQGKEYLAIQRFFGYYQIEYPAQPIIQIEFANPLFLHLICGSIKDAGLKKIPDGSIGLKSIIQLVLSSKNKLIADKCDYDENDQLVYAAIRELSKIIINQNKRIIPYSDAKKVVEAIHTNNEFGRSLFCNLIKEGLLTQVKIRQQWSLNYDIFCRFTFEKMADYFIATSICDDCADIESIGKRLLELNPSLNKNEIIEKEKGILEILSILIPEKLSGSELTDIFVNLNNEEIEEKLILIVLSGFSLREKSSFSYKTEKLVNYGYNKPAIAYETINALFGISFYEGNILNFEYLNKMYRELSLSNRDAHINFILKENYERKDNVYNILNWVTNADVSFLNNETSYLLALALSWFSSSSDRRIRDRATKGLTRVFSANPDAIVRIFKQFEFEKDDYILESISLAAYSALLIADKQEGFKNILEYIYSFFFMKNNLPLNALIRDNLRLMMEIGYDKCLFSYQIDIDKCRPPYLSEYKFSHYSDEELEEFKNRENFHSNLVMGRSGLGTDFQIYKLDTMLRNFDIKTIGLAEKDFYGWFMNSILDMGYPGGNNNIYKYDSFLLEKYGGGRSREKWAERIGKKYYWILLHRLSGILSDICPVKTRLYDEDYHSQNGLQGLNPRKLDATDFRSLLSKQDLFSNAKQAGYDFNKLLQLSDKEWVAYEDFPNPTVDLYMTDTEQNDWVALVCYITDKFILETGEEYDNKPYRDICNYTNSVLIKKSDYKTLLKTLNSEELSFTPSDFTPLDNKLFLGEYPYVEETMKYLHLNGNHLFRSNTSYLNTNIEFLRGNEWEYDCSSDEYIESIQVPSPEIIKFGNLKWDGGYCWKDNEKNVQAFYDEVSFNGVLVKKDYLNNFLDSNDLVLIHLTYQEKRVIYGMPSGKNAGYYERRGAYRYSNKGSKLLSMNNTKPT